jgi:restriction system protein
MCQPINLNPYKFEALVENLFRKMGLETRLTRSSRNGSINIVAFDARPVLGGKVVVQTRRYRNTVGISAVQDLYGTMLHEGANKRIIVSTSSYGPDAYDFSNNKPIEMIDGGGLLYLMDQSRSQCKNCDASRRTVAHSLSFRNTKIDHYTPPWLPA